jgi:methyl-accepting chemotaxis protein
MKTHAKKGKSLKFKLIALSIGITVLLGGASIGVLKHIVGTQQKAQLDSFEAYARSLSDAIGAQFFERYGDVQAFSISPAIQSNNHQTIVDMLNSWSAMYGIYDLILLVDAKGRLVATTSKSPTGEDIGVKPLYDMDYSDAPWFKAVMEGKFTEDKAKGFAGTFVEGVQVDAWTSKVYGSDRLGSSFSAPVKNAAGKVIGVISNRAGSRWFEVAFKELYAGLKKSGFGSSELSLLRQDGVVLFDYASDPKAESLSESKYDWNRLLKVSETGAAAAALKEGRSGALLENNSKSGELQIAGFVPVSGGKFVDSLGWSVLVRDDQAEAMSSLNQAQNIFYAIFALVIAFSCLISYLFAVNLAKTLSNLAGRLSEGSNEVHTAASAISHSSTGLSEAVVEQAAAIQETAASIDEVSSMVKMSADNASQSQKVSQTSRATAEEGQEAVQEMSRSIAAISESNTAIMTQIEERNRQIGEIVKVIAEIGNKTKVINDIVFQTKLLSFNASVEAARAGEHGKGFAVVAEEVGNLAQMSGNAAKEISTMLDSSIQKVEGIVAETRTEVERLVVESKDKVEVGIQVAERCGDVLTKILATVQEVDGMVGEISSASQEQAQGVAEINKAMNQLDQVTQQNSSISQSTASSATLLSGQSEQLRQMVRDLFFVINGTEDGSRESHSPESQSSGGARPEKQVQNVVALKPKLEEKKNQSATKNERESTTVATGTGPSFEVPSKDDPRFQDV